MSKTIYAVVRGQYDDYHAGPYFFSKFSAQSVAAAERKRRVYSEKTAAVEEFEVFNSEKEYYMSEHIEERV